MKNKVLKLVAATVLALGCHVPASASTVTLFTDDFNRANSNTVGNGWTESGGVSSVDVAIAENMLRLRHPNATATQAVMSTVGYTDITLDITWAGLPDSEPLDELFVEWRNTANGAWTRAATLSMGSTSFQSRTIQLTGADSSALFQFRLFGDASRADEDEGALVDVVTLNGVVASASVPEPSSLLLLLGAGLALATTRRR